MSLFWVFEYFLGNDTLNMFYQQWPKIQGIAMLCLLFSLPEWCARWLAESWTLAWPWNVVSMWNLLPYVRSSPSVNFTQPSFMLQIPGSKLYLIPNEPLHLHTSSLGEMTMGQYLTKIASSRFEHNRYCVNTCGNPALGNHWLKDQMRHSLLEPLLLRIKKSHMKLLAERKLLNYF